jgi:tetratricopeptide (TPR) repeat protein
MADTIKSNSGEPQVVTEKTSAQPRGGNLQSSFEKNQKIVIGAVVAIVLLVGGYFGYQQFIAKPNEEKAANALFSAQRWFEVDSLNYTLNGDGQHQGALSVIKKYGSTKAGNLARYYAGMSYLRLGDAKNAIPMLEKFNGEGTPLQYLAYGALGDAYMETNNSAKGIDMYKKAAGNEKDNFISPLYLFRAALATEQAGKLDEAKKLYLELKDKYPYSQQGNEAEKYLARLGDVAID